MRKSEANSAQAPLDVGQLSFDINTGAHWRRGVVILKHQQPLLPNIGKPDVKNGFQEEVGRTVPRREAVRDLI